VAYFLRVATRKKYATIPLIIFVQSAALRVLREAGGLARIAIKEREERTEYATHPAS